jgi:hypothetical protein
VCTVRSATIHGEAPKPSLLRRKFRVTLLDPVNSLFRFVGFRSRSAWKPASPTSLRTFLATCYEPETELKNFYPRRRFWFRRVLHWSESIGNLVGNTQRKTGERVKAGTRKKEKKAKVFGTQPRRNGKSGTRSQRPTLRDFPGRRLLDAGSDFGMEAGRDVPLAGVPRTLSVFSFFLSSTTAKLTAKKVQEHFPALFLFIGLL